jgi:hypothetical protein
MLQEILQHYYSRLQSFAPKFHQVPSKKNLVNKFRQGEVKKEEIALEWQNPQRDQYLPHSQYMLQEYVLGYPQNRRAFVRLWI